MIDIKTIFSYNKSNTKFREVTIPYELKVGIWEGFQYQTGVGQKWPIRLSFNFDGTGNHNGTFEIEDLSIDYPLIKSSISVSIFGTEDEKFSPEETRSVLKALSKVNGSSKLKSQILIDRKNENEKSQYIVFIIRETSIIVPDELTNAGFDYSGKYYCIYDKNAVTIRGIYITDGAQCSHPNEISLSLKIRKGQSFFNFK